MMLEEEGVVKEVRGDKALVITERSGCCAECMARRVCHVSEEGDELQAQVLNPVGAGVGDKVRIAIREGVLLKSSLILYLIPALGLILGSTVGYYMGRSHGWNLDLSAMLSGLLFLGLSFLVAFTFNQHVRKKTTYWPQIKEIISKGSPDLMLQEPISEEGERT